MAPQVRMKSRFLPSSCHNHVALGAGISAKREQSPATFSASIGLGSTRFTGPSLALPLFLFLAWLLSSCASLLGFPTYYDATTYKNLTDLKAESLFLYDTFATDSLDDAKVTAVRLKLAQAYEYEKGKGEKNKETREQLDLIQQMFGRHVSDHTKNGKWNTAHLANQKTNLGEAFDIAIATERLKNKNE